ncbi:Cobalamin synthase [uncultured Desulfatiglans sp.]|nr:Cobalamin synthase [uncultured Desulfatiglans sp.]
MQGLRSAIRTLTLIPVPAGGSEDLGRALPWFPVAGLLLGSALYAVDLAFRQFPLTPWPAGTALLIVALQTVLTRGLHLDGLGDWADSLGGYLDREKRLAIMKDVHIGAFGVAAIGLDLLAKWIACERLVSAGRAAFLIPVAVLSRGMMVWLISTLPYARAGEGMGRPFVQGATPGRCAAALAICLSACLPFGPAGIGLFGLAWATAVLLGLRWRRSFGGITGDLLGTANEGLEIVLLLAGAWLVNLPS